MEKIVEVSVKVFYEMFSSVCSLKQFISPNICLLMLLRLREPHRIWFCPFTSYHITEADKNISRWQFDSLKERFVETSKKWITTFLKVFSEN